MNPEFEPIDGQPPVSGSQNPHAGECCACPTAALDRAVFTSIRSPMGSGYQVVAASAGVSADEKREITQRAPSHGNLCDNTPDAEALAAFVLRSQRHCVFLSRHAGAEPSGRGGYRIHTHVLLLDDAQFRALGGDVLSVQQQVNPVLDWQPPPANQRGLAPLTLELVGPPAEPADPAPPTSEVEVMLALLHGALTRRRLVVWNAPQPLERLRTLLGALPPQRRQELSCAVGMRHSTQRDFDLVLVSGSGREFEQVIAEEGVAGVDWAAPPEPVESDFGEWLLYARRCWESGRTQRLRWLSDRLSGATDACLMNRVARLESLAIRTAVLNLTALDEVLQTLCAMPLESALELELSEHVRSRVAERKRELALLSGR